ncbi:hypothetical protein N657DRAFT_482153 [Parathielavia appendiculata]|uniref:Uncharacterized protein n=1 Tax=Parathielavia appendiculata TaxID=2587402 RepID=A0AAN6TYX5_9PEZI|nr:hypothetical protein N657DRAFT_482153 [Parathielavia appendiculata]
MLGTLHSRRFLAVSRTSDASATDLEGNAHLDVWPRFMGINQSLAADLALWAIFPNPGGGPGRAGQPRTEVWGIGGRWMRCENCEKRQMAPCNGDKDWYVLYAAAVILTPTRSDNLSVTVPVAKQTNLAIGIRIGERVEWTGEITYCMGNP